MSEASLFDQLNPVRLAIATEVYGFAFAGAGVAASGRLVHDRRISPEVMVAGLCRAHAYGLGSAIASAPHGDDFRTALIDASITLIRSTVK